jgi:aminopeptidase
MREITCKILIILALVTVDIKLFAQDLESFSKRIVNQTAGIKAGDVVLIQGGKHTISLMEQIAAEIHRKGAHPMMFMESDLALKALWHEKPEASLSDYPKYIVELYKQVNYVIALPQSENIKEIRKGVDPKRSALLGSNGEKLVEELSKGTHASIIISYPTRQVAEMGGIDFEVYERMHWAAANTDYKSIADKGEKLKALRYLAGILEQVKNRIFLNLTNLKFL